MKKKISKLATLAMVLMIVILSGCNKPEEDAFSYNDGTNESFDNDVSMGFGSQSENIPPDAFITFDQLIVDDEYKHMYQKSSGVNCGSSACLPTSYMMARKIVYPGAEFSVDELNNLRTRMHTECGGVYIDEAASVAKKDFGDCNPGKFKVKSNSGNPGSDHGRFQTKGMIQDWLSMGYPLIARVEVKKNTGAISATNAATHFVVIVGLTLTDVGTGSTIYYIDPLKRHGEILDCDFTRFLNSMKAENGFYYLLPIGCSL